MTYKSLLPNLLTIANLGCGFLGIIYIAGGDLVSGAIMIWIAATFDFFDGFIARILSAQSSIGKELDSLADVVSFGVLPSLIVFNLYGPNVTYLQYFSFLLLAASSIRLAKFNVDDTQAIGFKGLPTPANAILISSFPFLAEIGNWNFAFTPAGLTVISIFLSILMVSNLKLISLKFQGTHLNTNWDKYLLLLSSLILLVYFQTSAIPLIFVLYIVVSVLKQVT